MASLWHALGVWRVICRYRLLSLLPAHPLRSLLLPFQYLLPAGDIPDEDGERLAAALEALGPIYIKLGQLLATRRDLLPPAWTNALERLQDQVPPFPGEEALAVVEASLGQSVDIAFQHFDIQPLASASVAQVHPARLHDGREVVVKVIRPGIREQVVRDLRLMKASAGLLESLWRDARYFHPLRVVQDYEDIILGELDLLQEARNTQAMRRHFLFSPLLHIPEVHTSFGSRDIMVMERIHGIPVNDIEAIRAAGINPQQLAERGVAIFFAQVFRFNFFHADMHPGNIFVNPQRPEAPQYIAVDCAIAGQLSRQDLHMLGRLALMVIRQDYGGMVALVIRAGWARSDVDRERLRKALESLIDPVFAMPLDQLEFAPLVMKLFDTARTYHIEAPLQYILLVKTLVHIEGLGRSIYPQLDIWEVGKPLLEQWMLDEFGPVATMKKLRERVPEWAAQLPEMPELLHDAMDNLRSLPQLERRLEDRHAAALAQHRRKLLAGLTGLGLMTLPLWSPSAISGAAGMLGVLGLVWAVRR